MRILSELQSIANQMTGLNIDPKPKVRSREGSKSPSRHPEEASKPIPIIRAARLNIGGDRGGGCVARSEPSAGIQVRPQTVMFYSHFVWSRLGWTVGL